MKPLPLNCCKMPLRLRGRAHKWTSASMWRREQAQFSDEASLEKAV